jgi:hypothetical protein
MPRVYIPSAIRLEVIERADGQCEFCLLHQDDAETPHQIDHLIAIKHGGRTIAENLALACQLCNRHKGSDLTAIDPEGSAIVPLFNPRAQKWEDHFGLQGARIVGLTPSGRATVILLRLNGEDRLIDRNALAAAGRYPPP